ncbi:MAG: hypothetical protein H7Y06_06050 [Opitutaceae bacterium]|nr:hypothetical protein [Opitutaceae bacterium]
MIALHDIDSVKAARDTTLATLSRGSTRILKKVGWKGANGEYPLIWRQDAGFWVIADPFPNSVNRWILLFGEGDPRPFPMVGITCEINPPKSGLNLKCAGLFVRDTGGDGAVYFAHTGKIGGGRKGISAAHFWRNYQATGTLVNLPGRPQPKPVVLIGRVDSPELPFQIAAFVREVARIKQIPSERNSGILPLPLTPPPPAFKPEFSGRRAPYSLSGQIEADCNHGRIVSALAAEIDHRGLKHSKDQPRDLYLYDFQHRMTVLFEAKTTVSTTSIYQAIGQLLYHSYGHTPRPRLVLVIPEVPEADTASVLRDLGIFVLTFNLNAATVSFTDLESHIS